VTDQDSRDAASWFEQHFNQAADEILEFLAGDGLDLKGKVVADVGSGDGIIDLALATKGAPESLVGYDIKQTDTTALLRSAKVAGAAEELPHNLAFVASEPEHIPAVPEAFDVVVTWSVFEHVSNPVALLSEVRRILRPDGVLFMQIWPLYYSEHGGHLWPHYEEGFPHLLHHDDAILNMVEGKAGTYPHSAADSEYRSLNRLTLDDLQRALLSNRLLVSKLELLAQTTHIPPQLAHVPLSALGIGGVKLLAIPR
jgi:SAM-dependent methyltransferase